MSCPLEECKFDLDYAGCYSCPGKKRHTKPNLQDTDVFKAEYDGNCQYCRQDILVGDPIYRYAGCYFHAEC